MAKYTRNKFWSDSHRAAAKDIATGLSSFSVWGVMGLQEIQQRYRRSVLGPFWITISTTALILSMGPLYGRLFSQDLNTYFSYLAIGLIIWQTLSALLNEAGYIFISSESYIKQIKIPFAVYILKSLLKNIIIFSHNFIIIIVVLVVYRKQWGFDIFLFPIGLLLVFINGFWISLLFGIISARFRDMPMMISNAIQVVFFLTPIMWKKEMLGRHDWVADINPLYHLIEVIRAPLLGGQLPTGSFIYVALLGLIGNMFAFLIFSKFRSRISYWI